MPGILVSSVLATVISVIVLAALAVGSAVVLAGMGIPGALALYFVVWWTTLFVVLPLGSRSQSEAGLVVPGTELGAPERPMIRERAILTTGLADIVFIIAILAFPLAGL